MIEQANALTRRIMNAGLQCQMLGSRPEPRLGLRNLCWRLRVALVPSERDAEQVLVLIRQTEVDYWELVNGVPGFDPGGVAAMPPRKHALNAVRILRSAKSAAGRVDLELAAAREEYRAASETRTALIKGIADPTVRAEVELLQNEMEQMRDKLARLEERVRAGMFFGADVSEIDIGEYCQSELVNIDETP